MKPISNAGGYQISPVYRGRMIELDTYAGIDRDLLQILDYCATYRREFPDVPLEIIITPTPHRLGDKPLSTLIPLFP